MKEMRLVCAATVVAFMACESAKSKPANPTQAPEVQASWKAGAELANATTVSVSQLVDSPDKYHEKNVRLAGTVTKVCQARGCWTEITDGTSKVIVKSLDHGIAFPKDSSGQKVVVDGVVRIKPAKSCDHEHEEGHSHDKAAGGHECPSPEMLVEVKGAKLLANS